MEQILLEQIAKMLRAQLMGAGHLWWVAGYIYGQTSNGDLFVILYPAAENLKEKVVRVYDHDFRKLPAFIPTEGIDAGDTEANPSKEQARKKGIYHECPAFEIVTYDGKDTQMGKERRFGDVLRLSKAAREALATRPQAGQPPQPHQEAPRPTATQPPPPPPPPPADVLPGALPDYRALAEAAETPSQFDYAAFMTLRNGLYTEQEHITKTREVLVSDWKPGKESNQALLVALEVYRDKRQAAQSRGEAAGAAHSFAKLEAQRAYSKEING